MPRPISTSESYSEKCINGHIRDEGNNLRWTVDGKIRCRECDRLAAKRAHHRKLIKKLMSNSGAGPIFMPQGEDNSGIPIKLSFDELLLVQEMARVYVSSVEVNEDDKERAARLYDRLTNLLNLLARSE